MIGVLIYIAVVFFLLRLIRSLHQRDQQLFRMRNEEKPKKVA
jgi:hypothetical protein